MSETKTCPNCGDNYNRFIGHECFNFDSLDVIKETHTIKPEKRGAKTQVQKNAEQQVVRFLRRQILPMSSELFDKYAQAVKGVLL